MICDKDTMRDSNVPDLSIPWPSQPRDTVREKNMISEMIHGADTMRDSSIPDFLSSLAFQDQGVRHWTAGP